MNETPRSVPARHRARLVAALGAMASLVVLASGCALPSLGKTTGNSVCADKVAQASVSGSVPGLWKCLDDSLQTTLHSYGQDGDGALIKTPFASSVKALGCTADVCVYELTLLPAVAQQAGVKTAVLAVWIDKDGKARTVGIPSEIY
jgi:hypothetical protein